MPSVPGFRIEPPIGRVFGNGFADTETLRVAFAGGPWASGQHSNARLTAQHVFMTHGIIGTAGRDLPGTNPDFNNFDLDFGGGPAPVGTPMVALDVPTGPSGLPWTAYVPNVASPIDGELLAMGPGHAAAIPEPPPGGPASSGAGSSRTPSETAPQVAAQRAGPGVHNLTLGKSGATP